MKTTKALFGILGITLGLLASVAFTCSAHGEIFVLSFSSSGTNLVIGDYTTSGVTVNASLIQSSITQNNCSGGLAYDGNGHLFASNPGGIGEYTTSGATVNASLISSLDYVSSVVVDGAHLFVMYYAGFLTGGTTIGEYTTSGTPVNASLISEVPENSVGLKGDGNGHLFVLTGPKLAEYTTSGATLYASLITFSSYCTAFAVDTNGYIYVANGNTNTISKYTTAGVLVNASLVSGLPTGFSVWDMTLDGNGNLLLLMHSFFPPETHVAEYTTSGQLVNSSLISGLQGCPTSIISINSIPAAQPSVNLIKAVVPTFADLLIGTNYQLQVSSSVNTWTNQGLAFRATNSSMVYPQYWGVDNWGKLFFRLQVAP
jgi:hypothetical protein